MSVVKHFISTTPNITETLASLTPSLTLPELDIAHPFRMAAEKYREKLTSYSNNIFELPDYRRNQELGVPKTHQFNHKVGKHDFKLLHIEADNNPKHLAVIFTGCKSKGIHWKEQIDYFLNNNMSVFVVNSNVEGLETGFAAEHYQMCEDLLLDVNSIIYKIAKKNNLKIALVAHSFGGTGLSHSLKNPKIVNKIADNKDMSLVFINAFWGSVDLTGDSMVGKAESYMFGLHTKMSPESRYGENIFEIGLAHAGQLKRKYIEKVEKKSPVWVANGYPARAQIEEMQEGAKEILDVARNGAFPERIKEIPITVIIGGKDTLAHPQYGRTVAMAMGADIVELPDNDHSPFHESPEKNIPLLVDVLTGTHQENQAIKKQTQIALISKQVECAY